MGGGEHGVCGRHTCVRARFGRWQGVYQVTKGVAFPPLATACAEFPTMARPWQRGRSIHGGEAQRKRKGPKVQPRPRVGVRACWGARWRESVGLAWSHARTRTRARTARRGVTNASGTAQNGEKNRLS
jgi:hypothetical protein